MNSLVSQWDYLEFKFTSRKAYDDPLRDVRVQGEFTAPSGRKHRAEGFWDGGSTWRVRFSPDEVGDWTCLTLSSDTSNSSLHGQNRTFTCLRNTSSSRFAQHGRIRIADNGRHLVHADGTPFFWLADTAWNGPLRSTASEWQHYLNTRVKQRFTAVQWVATQWIGAPQGDYSGRQAYSGHERITVNPVLFQHLDAKISAINAAGMLAVPVLLWVAGWSTPEVNACNPGYALAEDQAVLLAKYMIARWHAHHVVWLLNGDGDYRGEKAERWQRIGRQIFADTMHAPVSLHPQGLHWNMDEFRDEEWLDIVGYQCGQYGDEESLDWSVAGPPTTDWGRDPSRPVIHLEPPYEQAIGIRTGRRFTADEVRRALYWSLLVSPPAGVSYGGHGVWGWDDGSSEPKNHEGTGVPLPWHQALHMTVADQIQYLADLFNSLAWWTLRPAPELVLDQPGQADRAKYIAAARSDAGALIVVYVPCPGQFTLDLAGMRRDLSAYWFDPRCGDRILAAISETKGGAQFETPSVGDWVLVCQPNTRLPVKYPYSTT